MYIKVLVVIFIVNSCICTISTPWTRGSEFNCYIMMCTMSTECSYAPLRPSPLCADTPTKLVYLLSVALSSLKIALSALSSPFSLSTPMCTHTHIQLKEKEIATKLKWNLNAITAADFIEELSRRVAHLLPGGVLDKLVDQSHTLANICLLCK